MISLVCMEFRKLWTQKSILSLFLIVFSINLGLLYYEQINQPIPMSAYDLLQQDLMKQPNEKRYEYVKAQSELLDASMILDQLQALQIDPVGNQDMIAYLKAQYPDIETTYGQAAATRSLRYTDSIELETALFHEVYEEFQVLHAYPDTLKHIQQQANDISSVFIFSTQDSYSNRNIIKSAQDFSRMNTVTPIYQIQKPIVAALDVSYTNILIVIMGIGFVSAMILDEKQKGLLGLIKTTARGDVHTMIAKYIVMMIGMGIVCISLYGSNLILMNGLCRFGDVFAPLISLSDFSLMTLAVSIIEFFLIFLATKWLSACVIGGVMLCSAMISNHRVGCFLWILACLGMEWFFTLVCELQGPNALLKQLNLISFLDTASLYERYTNLNLFNTPLTYHQCALWILIVLLLIFACTLCLSYHHKQAVSLRQPAYPRWLHRIKAKHTITTSLFLQEAYKVLWIQKGALLLVGYLCFLGFTFSKQHMIQSQEERIWAQYAAQLYEKSPEEIEIFFQSQQAYFDSLHTRLDELELQYHRGSITRIEYDQLVGPLDLQLSGEQAFQAVQERYAYVREDEHREFLNPYGYEYYFMQEDTWIVPWMILLLVLILVLSDLVCMDYQHDTQRLIATTRLGRTRLFYHKLIVASCIGIFFIIATSLPILVATIQAYGVPNIFASVTSLPEYAKLPFSISFFTLFLFDFLLKFLACFAIIGTLIYLSHRVKHMRTVLCLLCLIFVLPLFLHLMGFSMMDAISLLPLCISTIQLTQESLVPLYTSILVYSFLSIYTMYHAYYFINAKK